jgi:hypothetical protein
MSRWKESMDFCIDRVLHLNHLRKQGKRVRSLCLVSMNEGGLKRSSMSLVFHILRNRIVPVEINQDPRDLIFPGKPVKSRWNDIFLAMGNETFEKFMLFTGYFLL